MRYLICLGLLALFCCDNSAAAPYGARRAPGVRRIVVKPTVHHARKKTKPRTNPGRKTVRRTAPTNKAPPVDPRGPLLAQVNAQIAALHAERDQLMATKQALLDTFAKTQAGFLFKLQVAREAPYQQSLLLALLAASPADFVHQSVILPYLASYLVGKNPQCANLLRNIRTTNASLARNHEKECELVNYWYAVRNGKRLPPPTQTR